jgi:hypothetical protein
MARIPAIACVCLMSGAATTLASSDADAQTIDGHPDLNGIYFPAGFARRTPQELPFTPGAAEMAEYWEANFRVEDEPGRFCIWPGMPRAPWGAPFPVEIFHRDYDVTIYWEGYGMFRKIYMADHDPPEPILHTAMGYSVAHWEGDELVVETTHLKAYPYFSGLATSSDAEVSEALYAADTVTCRSCIAARSVYAGVHLHEHDLGRLSCRPRPHSA